VGTAFGAYNYRAYERTVHRSRGGEDPPRANEKGQLILMSAWWRSRAASRVRPEPTVLLRPFMDHVGRARELEVADEDLVREVQTARAVKAAPARNVARLAGDLLRGGESLGNVDAPADMSPITWSCS
jgi:hypothetical protein